MTAFLGALRSIRVLGLDIGTSAVKLVELRGRRRRKPVLATYAHARLPVNMTDLRRQGTAERMAVIVREMMKRAQVRAKEVVVTLPSLSVFNTVITLPVMSPRELPKAVELAAQNYVPVPLKDVTLGWSLIGTTARSLAREVRVLRWWQRRKKKQREEKEVAEITAQKAERSVETSNAGEEQKKTRGKDQAQDQTSSSRHVEIFLTAAPRELVNQYTRLVNMLNLRLVALEVESFPLVRALLKDKRLPTLVVDIGDRATNLSIVEGGYLRLNQSIDVGGDAVTHSLIARLGWTPDKAEEEKKKFGISPTAPPAVREAMQAAVNSLITRARQFQTLYERNRKISIARVILIGGGSLLPGLREYWQRTVNVPTEIGNPFVRVQAPAELQERLRILGPSYAVAVGLALREFAEV
jgi:type IV pilus assembly protein PilM